MSGEGGILVTTELLARGMSHLGGWNRAQLSAIGIAWPPMRGWKKLVIGRVVSAEAAEQFLARASVDTARAA